MILSFSVPDNPKFKPIVDWYENTDKSERSRAFREILLSSFEKSVHILDSQAAKRISPVPLQMVNISSDVELDVDLDAKLDLIGMRG